MVTVKVHGETATCQDGVWKAESQAITRLLNAPWNQPDPMRYHMDPDIDRADHVVRTMGAVILQQDVPPTTPSTVY